MATYYTQDCPLCTSAAEYCYVDARNRKYFKCPNCTYFQISRRAEEFLSEKPPVFKDGLVNMAPRAPQESLLTIRMPSATDLKDEPEVSIKAGYVSKAELPLNCE